MFVAKLVFISLAGLSITSLDLRDARAEPEVLAVFQQTALFRHLRTLAIAPVLVISRHDNQYIDAFGSALGKLPALSALDLNLALCHSPLSSAIWLLPLLRRLRLSASSSGVTYVPVISAPSLEVFEATGLQAMHNVLHRVLDTAKSSEHLRFLTIHDDGRDRLPCPDAGYDEALAVLSTARWPVLTHLHLQLLSADAESFVLAFAALAPALRVASYSTHLLTHTPIRGLLGSLALAAVVRACVRTGIHRMSRYILPAQQAASQIVAQHMRFLEFEAEEANFSGLLFPGLHTLRLFKADIDTVDAALAVCPSLCNLILETPYCKFRTVHRS